MSCIEHFSSNEAPFPPCGLLVYAPQAELQAEKEARHAVIEESSQRRVREMAALRAENDELRRLEGSS